jgi:hypothetical protein
MNNSQSFVLSINLEVMPLNSPDLSISRQIAAARKQFLWNSHSSHMTTSGNHAGPRYRRPLLLPRLADEICFPLPSTMPGRGPVSPGCRRRVTRRLRLTLIWRAFPQPSRQVDPRPYCVTSLWWVSISGAGLFPAVRFSHQLSFVLGTHCLVLPLALCQGTGFCYPGFHGSQHAPRAIRNCFPLLELPLQGPGGACGERRGQTPQSGTKARRRVLNGWYGGASFQIIRRRARKSAVRGSWRSAPRRGGAPPALVNY